MNLPKFIKKDDKNDKDKQELRIWYNMRGNILIKTIYDPNKNIYITEEKRYN